MAISSKLQHVDGGVRQKPQMRTVNAFNHVGFKYVPEIPKPAK